MNPGFWSKTWIAVVLAVGMVCGPSAARGQAVGGPYRFAGQVVGGGGASQGGSFLLRGAVLASAGGRSVSTSQPGTEFRDFRLVGGVLGPVVPSVVRPTIHAVLTPDKLAALSWDMDIDGYVLEFSPSIGPGANWQPLDPQPTGRSFTTPCAQPARFFRLRER